MLRVSIIDGSNHGWDRCRVTFERALATDADLTLRVAGKADVLNTEALGETDVVVLGSGFMHMVGKPGAPGTYWAPELLAEEVEALKAFVSSGGGLLGLHITGWFLEAELFKLLGGSSNLHPPIEETSPISVQFVQGAHQLVEGLEDFSVENDELYLVAWSPDDEGSCDGKLGGKKSAGHVAQPLRSRTRFLLLIGPLSPEL